MRRFLSDDAGRRLWVYLVRVVVTAFVLCGVWGIVASGPPYDVYPTTHEFEEMRRTVLKVIAGAAILWPLPFFFFSRVGGIFKPKAKQ